MLPGSGTERISRRSISGGRTKEIQRLIGRCLRGAVWPARLGERTITIDCDVIQGDGGTRTASITGGFVALALALDKLKKDGKWNDGQSSFGLVKGKVVKIKLKKSKAAEAKTAEETKDGAAKPAAGMRGNRSHLREPKRQPG